MKFLHNDLSPWLALMLRRRQRFLVGALLVWVTLMAGLALLVAGFALWRGLRGWAWRGLAGLAAALALRAMGVDEVTVVEPNNARRVNLTERCGLRAVPAAEGAHPIVVDAVGFAVTRATASALAEPGGGIVHIGLGEDAGGLDLRRMTLQEITFIGTYTYTAQDFRDTAAALFDGRLGPLDWTEIRPLSDGAAAFRDIRSGQSAAPKIILQPDNQGV